MGNISFIVLNYAKALIPLSLNFIKVAMKDPYEMI